MKSWSLHPRPAGGRQQVRRPEAEVRLAQINPELQLWPAYGHPQHCGQRRGRKEVIRLLSNVEFNESCMSLVETFSLVQKCKIHFGYSNWIFNIICTRIFRAVNPFNIILSSREKCLIFSFFRLSVDVGIGWGVTQARLDRASFSYNYRWE